jgi:hypothetical protein
MGNSKFLNLVTETGLIVMKAAQTTRGMTEQSSLEQNMKNKLEIGLTI